MEDFAKSLPLVQNVSSWFDQSVSAIKAATEDARDSTSIRGKPHRGATVDITKVTEERNAKIAADKASELANEDARAMEALVRSNEMAIAAASEKEKLDEWKNKATAKQRVLFFGRPTEQFHLKKKLTMMDLFEWEQQASVWKHLWEDSKTEVAKLEDEYQNARARKKIAADKASALRARQSGAQMAAAGLAVHGDLADARQAALAEAEGYGAEAGKLEDTARELRDLEEIAKNKVKHENEKMEIAASQVRVCKSFAREQWVKGYELERREILELAEEDSRLDGQLKKWRIDYDQREGQVDEKDTLVARLKEMLYMKHQIRAEMRMFYPVFVRMELKKDKPARTLQDKMKLFELKKAERVKDSIDLRAAALGPEADKETAAAAAAGAEKPKRGGLLSLFPCVRPAVAVEKQDDDQEGDTKEGDKKEGDKKEGKKKNDASDDIFELSCEPSARGFSWVEVAQKPGMVARVLNKLTTEAGDIRGTVCIDDEEPKKGLGGESIDNRENLAELMNAVLVNQAKLEELDDWGKNFDKFTLLWGEQKADGSTTSQEHTNKKFFLANKRCKVCGRGAANKEMRKRTHLLYPTGQDRDLDSMSPEALPGFMCCKLIEFLPSAGLGCIHCGKLKEKHFLLVYNTDYFDNPDNKGFCKFCAKTENEHGSLKDGRMNACRVYSCEPRHHTREIKEGPQAPKKPSFLVSLRHQPNALWMAAFVDPGCTLWPLASDSPVEFKRATAVSKNGPDGKTWELKIGRGMIQSFILGPKRSKNVRVQAVVHPLTLSVFITVKAFSSISYEDIFRAFEHNEKFVKFLKDPSCKGRPEEVLDPKTEEKHKDLAINFLEDDIQMAIKEWRREPGSRVEQGEVLCVAHLLDDGEATPVEVKIRSPAAGMLTGLRYPGSVLQAWSDTDHASMKALGLRDKKRPPLSDGLLAQKNERLLKLAERRFGVREPFTTIDVGEPGWQRYVMPISEWPQGTAD